MSALPPAEETRERIAAALEGVEHEAPRQRDGMASVELDRSLLAEALSRLRDRAGFESVTFVTAVDHHPAEPRFEVVHQLWSCVHGERVRIVTRLHSDDPTIPTCTNLWPGAAFMERECFDMFGVVFEGHAGLRRLLMPEGYGHHPLRKDFPHQGIEPDRLYREWDRNRRREWSPTP